MQTTLFNRLYIAFYNDENIFHYKPKTNGSICTYNIITPSTEIILIILSKMCIIYSRRQLDKVTYINFENNNMDKIIAIILHKIKKFDSLILNCDMNISNQ